MIGKALQFIEFTTHKEKEKPYKGNYVNVSSNCGVLCTWYVKTADDQVNYTFEIRNTLDTSYHHVRN